MISRILDTSVCGGLVPAETFCVEARSWRSRLVQNCVLLLVASLHFLEMAKVRRTYVSRGDLEDDLALEIYDIHLQASLRVVDLPLDKILHVSFDYRSTTYDAAFISLAVVHQVPLLTAEGSTTPWVVKLGDLAETLH